MISKHDFGIFAKSVRVKLLLNCYTVAVPTVRLQPTPSLVWYTNRPFGHQRRYTKRLVISPGPRQLASTNIAPLFTLINRSSGSQHGRATRAANEARHG